MITTYIRSALFTLTVILLPIKSFSHCQVPCGIYEDSLRVQLIAEHITTVEKAMTQIVVLSEEGPKNYNQIVRWVNNKELHATKIQTIISTYFLHQRIKPVSKEEGTYGAYIVSLELLHRLSVLAMKAKQTTEPSLISKMRQTLKSFSDHYFKPHQH